MNEEIKGDLEFLATEKQSAAGIGMNRDVRFGFSLVATVLWIAIMVYIIFRDPATTAKMTPSDWGDFLSGAFAPVAFLWLVIGYMQQGEELRLSTKALHLQAEELRNSVEQQRALVEVSRMQVESEREALAQERKERVDSARPNIHIDSDGGSFRGDGKSTYHIAFSNAGNAAYSFRITIRYPLGRIIELYSSPIFASGASHRVTVEVERPELIERAMISLTCRDRFGNDFEHSYVVFRESDHPHASLRISKNEG